MEAIVEASNSGGDASPWSIPTEPIVPKAPNILKRPEACFCER